MAKLKHPFISSKENFYEIKTNIFHDTGKTERKKVCKQHFKRE